MNSTILAYIIYIVISFSVILRVGHILYNSGKSYLKELFPEHLEFASNVNKMLLYGYYLLVLGYSLIELKIGSSVLLITDIIPIMAGKLAYIVLIIAGIHYTNLTWMYIYARILDKKRNPELQMTDQKSPLVYKSRVYTDPYKKTIKRRIIRKHPPDSSGEPE